MNPQMKSMVLDLATGALIMVIVVPVAIVSTFQITFIAAAFLFLLAGFTCVCSEAENLWIHSILINILFVPLTFPFVIENPPIFVLPAASIICTLSGAYLRLHWKSSPLRKNSILVSIPVVGILLVGLLGLPKLMQFYLTKKVNAPVPQFDLSTLEGKSIKSADLAGQVVVLDFWTTRCESGSRFAYNHSGRLRWLWHLLSLSFSFL